MRAVVFGITGQDGAYLARLLLDRGIDVVGAVRPDGAVDLANLATLGVEQRCRYAACSLGSVESILTLIELTEPDLLFNLAGQSSVARSFTDPITTFASNAMGAINILEAVRLSARRPRVYQASSSEMFGETSADGADEESPFQPKSPYGVAKLAAHQAVRSYRESFGLFATAGILFNHESPLRSTQFVTGKVVRAAARTAAGERVRLNLGSLAITRDWGWAPDFVEAMLALLSADEPIDLVIGTGIGTCLRDFVEKVYSYFGLDWRDWISEDVNLIRPNEIRVSLSKPEASFCHLGWSAKVKMPELVSLLCRAAEDAVSNEERSRTYSLG